MIGDRSLPDDALPYAKTSIFTAETVPSKLTNTHNTKKGIWGRLNVNRGEVSYYLDGEDAPLAAIRAGETLIIQPEEWHFVRLNEDAEFFVEFYK
ncbi:MAG: DUF1971 domain-containing protein [Pseudomonadota bacterium]